MAVGMYDKLSSVALQPTSVWDVVPADMVAANILAAAAAVSAGAAAAISGAARSGVVKGSEGDARVVLGYTLASERISCRQPLNDSEFVTFAAKVADKCEPDVIPDAEISTESPSELIPAQCVYDDGDHNVATTNPSEGGSDSPSWLSLVSYSAENPLYGSSNRSSTHDLSSAGTESAMHSLAGTQQLRQRLPLLIVHAATSSTYPLTLMEGWNYLLPFLEAHPPPFR